MKCEIETRNTESAAGQSRRKTDLPPLWQYILSIWFWVPSCPRSWTSHMHIFIFSLEAGAWRTYCEFLPVNPTFIFGSLMKYKDNKEWSTDSSSSSSPSKAALTAFWEPWMWVQENHVSGDSNSSCTKLQQNMLPYQGHSSSYFLPHLYDVGITPTCNAVTVVLQCFTSLSGILF